MIPSSRPLRSAIVVALLWLGALAAQAKIQFDVFPGYDGTVRGAGWYPLGFEIFNDGPGFNAVIEVPGGQAGGQTLRIPVELPTNTRKRIVVPAFSTASGNNYFEARLLDDGGRQREEWTGKLNGIAAWEVPILGVLPATFAGMPAFPVNKERRSEWQAMVVRLQPEFLPDNPIALEGLNAIYLSSARALELKEPQAAALLAWLHAGGHLIVAVDQPADFNTATWLRGVLPADPGTVANASKGKELHQWVVNSRQRARHGYEPPTGAREMSERKTGSMEMNPYQVLPEDAAFSAAEQITVALRVRDGEILLGDAAQPLLVRAARGRGLITLLGVNPEREPFKSWTLRPWFFARVCDVPLPFLRNDEVNLYGGRSLDGVFGAMTDTRQIRKLPVGFLLLLLLVYLVVIGPLDQWWLKKINRPMLTWLTFPAYVAAFSLLIYYIGFKLRAGQREWNELHVVDVIPQGDGTRAALRGRTFASAYAPANETFRLASEVPQATMRAEFAGLWGAGTDGGRLTVVPRAAGFEAETFVPVWTSQLNVSEWHDVGEAPLTAEISGNGRNSTVRVTNRSGRRIGNVWVLFGGSSISSYEGVDNGATLECEMDGKHQTYSLPEFVRQLNDSFQHAVNSRGSAFGSNERAHIDDWAGSSIGASFGSFLSFNQGGGRDYVWPAGLDLSAVAARGDTIVFAWLPDATLVPPLNRFDAPRQKQGTLLRLVLPAK